MKAKDQETLAQANNLMESCIEHQWGWLVEYVGTREDLLAANIVGPSAFILPKSGSARGTDEYGTWYEIRRRARGRFKIEKRFSEESRLPWSPKYGRLSDVDVTPILQKFAK